MTRTFESGNTFEYGAFLTLCNRFATLVLTILALIVVPRSDVLGSAPIHEYSVGAYTNLISSMAQYLSPQYEGLVRKVVVVWNEKGPPPDLPEAVTVLRMHNASLNNRWTRVGEHVHTDAVLNLDDDVFVIQRER